MGNLIRETLPGDVLVGTEKAWMLLPDGQLRPLPYSRVRPGNSFRTMQRLEVSVGVPLGNTSLRQVATFFSIRSLATMNAALQRPLIGDTGTTRSVPSPGLPMAPTSHQADMMPRCISGNPILKEDMGRPLVALWSSAARKKPGAALPAESPASPGHLILAHCLREEVAGILFNGTLSLANVCASFSGIKAASPPLHTRLMAPASPRQVRMAPFVSGTLKSLIRI